MAHATRTFRIFVSSTFSDLVAERNALQARVWPRLRELCERRGARFQAIDLRWGVSDEASLDQRTMTICLEEIDRCRRITPRPNFIVLLGDRYGWRPLPPHIAAEHYVAIERLLSADDRALLTAWYRRDDNAVPPVYELQPRIQVAVAPPAPDPIAEVSPDVQEVLAWIEQELAALEQSAPEDGRQRPERGEHGHQSTLLACYQRLRELGARRPFQEVDLEAIQSTERDLWGHIESDLVTTLQGVAPDVGLEVADLYAFEASATEQEIRRGALRVEGPEQHVLCFFRRIRNRGDLEVAARAGRPGSDFLDVDGAGNPDTAAQARLEALKAELRRQLPEGNILDLDAEWVGPEEGPVLPVYGEAGPATEPEAAGTVGKEPAQPERSPIALKHLDRLCDAVYAALERTIEAELKSFERLDSVTREREAHWQFGRDRAAHFKGRREQLGKIADYLARDTPQPLVVYGPSGSGKSALIAEAARRTVPLELRDLGEPPAAETGPVLVQRFIGATPGASDGRALLEGMCAELAQLYGQGAKAPSDYNELVQELPRRIGLASDERPLYLFLDALDQLSERDGATSLAWLPSTLPDYARVVVSVLSDGPPARLAHLVEDDHLLEVPPLSGKEAEELLTTWLGSVGRRLEPEQQGEVMDRFKLSRLVLYLKLAFEEARHWRSFTSAAETSLPPDVPGIIRALFVRLAQGEHHGPLLVERSLAYLGAGRGGLSEDELLDVLSADAEVLVEFRRHSPRSPATDRLPPVVWSRLYFDLEPYLAEHAADGANVLGFYHRQLGEVVAAEYLKDDAQVARHAAIADYFFREHYPRFLRGNQDAATTRMLAELGYHQIMAGQWVTLKRTLADLRFLEARCAVPPTEAARGASAAQHRLYRLMEDLELATTRLAAVADRDPAREDLRQRLSVLQASFWAEVNVLATQPELLAQQIFNRLLWSGAPSASLRTAVERAIAGRRATGASFLRQVAPFAESAFRTQRTGDAAGEVREVLPREQGFLILLSGGTWKQLDASGLEREQGSLLDLEYSYVTTTSSVIAAVAGPRVLLWFDRLDTRPRVKPALFSVQRIALSPAARRLLVCGYRGEWALYELAGDRYEIVHQGQLSRPITACCLTIAGDPILGTEDGRLFVAGAPPRELSFRHTRSVTALAAAPNSPEVASAGQDSQVLVFTPQGQLLGQWRHEAAINDVRFGPAGHPLLAAAESGSLLALDLAMPNAGPVPWTSEGVPLVRAVPSADGSVVATLDRHHALRLVRPPEVGEASAFELPLAGDVMLVTAFDDHRLLVCDAHGWRCLVDLSAAPPASRALPPTDGSIRAALSLEPGAYLTVHGPLGQGRAVIHSWDGRRFTESQVWPSGPLEILRTILDGCITADRRHLVLSVRKSGSQGSLIRLIDLRSREVVTYDMGDEEIMTLAASNGATNLLLGSTRRFTPPKLLRNRRAPIALPITGNPDQLPVGCKELAIDAAGRRIAAIDAHGEAWLASGPPYDASSFARIARETTMCAMAPDGSRLLLVSASGSLNLLDLRGPGGPGWDPAAALAAVQWRVTHCGLDPDRRRVYLGGQRAIQVLEWA